jgi:hypothetical protein
MCRNSARGSAVIGWLLLTHWSSVICGSQHRQASKARTKTALSAAVFNNVVISALNGEKINSRFQSSTFAAPKLHQLRSSLPHAHVYGFWTQQMGFPAVSGLLSYQFGTIHAFAVLHSLEDIRCVLSARGVLDSAAAG